MKRSIKVWTVSFNLRLGGVITIIIHSPLSVPNLLQSSWETLDITRCYVSYMVMLG